MPSTQDAAQVSHHASALTSQNALSLNGVVANGLLSNGLTLNGVRMNGVRMNGVRMNGLSINDLPPDESMRVLRYLVECALPAEHSITVTIDDVPQPFYGALGLAPALEYDALTDPGDQEWVSACLMARTNSAGQTVPISLRGQHPALAVVSSQEQGDYRIADSAFFGNLFKQDDASTPFIGVCPLSNGDARIASYVSSFGRGAGFPDQSFPGFTRSPSCWSAGCSVDETSGVPFCGESQTWTRPISVWMGDSSRAPAPLLVSDASWKQTGPDDPAVWDRSWQGKIDDSSWTQASELDQSDFPPVVMPPGATAHWIGSGAGGPVKLRRQFAGAPQNATLTISSNQFASVYLNAILVGQVSQSSLYSATTFGVTLTGDDVLAISVSRWFNGPAALLVDLRPSF
jgi:hypothetical protein